MHEQLNQILANVEGMWRLRWLALLVCLACTPVGGVVRPFICSPSVYQASCIIECRYILPLWIRCSRV